ncbi:heat shock factor protein isoform X1 [Drosophila rhopaloa]|uniref:Heat shock factor protein isoform X1 n=1 Tax=Drosophila rhopaloa TaxID=1041015 RepID=A0A6P4F6D1_DRORH|nr:heat shock factor protein isoform X1 [Drosophila rhopaloa]XP_016985986.1 heat shock factor protein isoform X1 [Drosophila rhopaloa]XP_016985987.1 heat shock factor protein isoform X1 [Drosophila rhopaloa]
MSRSRSSAKAVQFKHESEEEEDDEEEQLPPRSMHSFGDGGAIGSGVPAFLAKLWRLVDDGDTNRLICWTKDGHSFVIQNQAQFAKELLPLNYKHNNMASFIRQLNMYGFHKITSIDNGGLRFDRDEIEFSHPFFKRNSPYLLDQIKRKISNNKNGDDKSVLKQEAVSKILSDVKVMRGRQDNLDSRFSAMKQENEVLWREIASLRQKHAKQQQIVNKLIQFLISIVQPSRNMSGVKRHMQLMINDTPENDRARSTSETESEGGGGPVIHELSEELLDEVMNPSPAGYVAASQYDQESASPLTVERPRSNISISSHNVDYSNQSVEDLLLQGNGSAGGNLLVGGAASPLASSVSRSPAQHVVYTVTEVPDSHVQEVPNSPPHHEEQNVLTTPMVREQEQKRQQLKEQNKLRRRPADDIIEVEMISPKAQRNGSQPKTKENVMLQPMMIKSEPENNSSLMELMQPTNSDLYNVNFISENMPTDIFEDSSLLPAGLEEAAKLDQQQKFGQSTVSSGKFASHFDVPTNSSLVDANQASTSKAAAAKAQATEEEAMAVAKYTGSENGPTRDPNNGQLLRIPSVLVDKMLSTPSQNSHNQEAISYCCSDDLHGHLDNMQDELETLKDLLRGDGVAIDQNMLMGLFNDSDLLDNYGLSFPNDSMSSEKKAPSGSELISYQPMYDLSDILDSNDGNKDQEANRRQLQTQNSVLNTPRHEL